MTDNRTDSDVTAIAREVLADAADIRNLTLPQMGSLIGRLAGTMQGLLEYIDLLNERIDLTRQTAHAAGRAEVIRERDERFDQSVAHIRGGAR